MDEAKALGKILHYSCPMAYAESEQIYNYLLKGHCFTFSITIKKLEPEDKDCLLNGKYEILKLEVNETP